MCKSVSTRSEIHEKSLVGNGLREWRPVLDASRSQRGSSIVQGTAKCGAGAVTAKLREGCLEGK